MFRRTILLAGMALGVTSGVFAQQSTTPVIPEDALTPRELIAWSDLQTPRPTHEPPPPPQAEPREPDRNSGAHSQQPNSVQVHQEPQSHNDGQSPSPRRTQ
jgi:hypothetical protein